MTEEESADAKHFVVVHIILLTYEWFCITSTHTDVKNGEVNITGEREFHKH